MSKETSFKTIYENMVKYSTESGLPKDVTTAELNAVKKINASTLEAIYAKGVARNNARCKRLPNT